MSRDILLPHYFQHFRAVKYIPPNVILERDRLKRPVTKVYQGSDSNIDRVNRKRI